MGEEQGPEGGEAVNESAAAYLHVVPDSYHVEMVGPEADTILAVQAHWAEVRRWIGLLGVTAREAGIGLRYMAEDITLALESRRAR